MKSQPDMRLLAAAVALFAVLAVLVGPLDMQPASAGSARCIPAPAAAG